MHNRTLPQAWPYIHSLGALPPETPWPEIPWPNEVRTGWDPLAGSAGSRSRPIWGEGNVNGEIMVILDNPGAREDKEGRPFVCGTRQTLKQAVVAAGLDPQNLYVTYLLKRRPWRAYNHLEAWHAYLPLLRRQIGEVAPRVLICLGNTVVRALLGAGLRIGAGDERMATGADPADPGGVKELREERLLFSVATNRPAIPTIVSYHPLAARRRPHLFPRLVEDLAKAQLLLPSTVPPGDVDRAAGAPALLPERLGGTDPLCLERGDQPKHQADQ